MTRAGQDYYLHADHQGSIVRVTDAAGAVVNSYEYDAYGRRLAATEGVDLPYGYTGREFDAESGLMYYRARMYDPATGRFLQTDPLGFAAGDLNIYRYVLNNPINGTDPSGLLDLTRFTLFVGGEAEVVHYGGLGASAGRFYHFDFPSGTVTYGNFVEGKVGVGMDSGAGGILMITTGGLDDAEGFSATAEFRQRGILNYDFGFTQSGEIVGGIEINLAQRGPGSFNISYSDLTPRGRQTISDFISDLFADLINQLPGFGLPDGINPIVPFNLSPSPGNCGEAQEA